MQKQIIAITANFTAEPVEESLGFWMRELHIPSEIKFAPYNQVFQQLLDPASLLSTNRHGVNVVLVRFEDWGKLAEGGGQGSPSNTYEKIERSVRDLVRAIGSAAQRSATPYLVYSCPASGGSAADPGLTAFFRRMEELMASEWRGAGGTYLVTASELASAYPVATYDDPRADKLGHVPYTRAFFASLGTSIARKIYAVRNAPYKVIALDCDQTLWKGVCGEDGPLGVEIDPPRRALQEFVVAQHRAGMLICLCSKNNEEDVVEVFGRRPEMPLGRDHIAAWRVNWGPKSENLRALSAELRLGLDSFVFIDDDPVACAEVQANCPEVLTLQLPQEPDRIPAFLDHVWAFDRLEITGEDQRRTALYKENSERERFREESLSFENFLASLGLEIQIAEARPHHFARVSQLTQRTNQFNFTTIRRSENEIRTLCRAGGSECLITEVSDRFGSYGLVGVIVFGAGAGAIKVDTFLLSCRALGRGVEHRMLAELGKIARARGLGRVDVTFIDSGRNQPAGDFLEGVGAGRKRRIDGGYLFEFPAEFAAGLTYAPGAAGDFPERRSSAARPAPPPADGAGAKSALMRRIATDLSTPEQLLKILEPKERRARPDLKETYLAPRTPVEEALAGICVDVLKIERVGVHDNFFELGGHSLLIVQVASRIHDEFAVELPPRSFFEGPTVANLAVAITQGRAAQRDADEIEQLLEKLDRLSPEEVEALLGQKSAPSLDPPAPRAIAVNEEVAAEAERPAPGAAEAVTEATAEAERYRCADVERFTVGDGLELVYARGSRTARVLRSGEAELLARCQRFETLDGHARDLAAELRPGGEGRVASVREQLAELADAGLLDSYRNLLDRLSRPSGAREDSAPVASVVFPTFNRVDGLNRALSSYIENRRRHGRANDFVVVDGSQGAATRTSYRQMLNSLKRRYGVEISYAGLEERVRYAKKLMDAGDLPADVVNFALFDVEKCGHDYGVSRNALALHTVGDVFLSVDDDTVCQVAPAPGSDDGLTFVPRRDPAEIYSFPDREAALGSVRFADADFLAIHEQLLGRNLRDYLSAMGKTARVNFDETDSRFLRGVESGAGKVLVTYNGWVGDCAWGSPLDYLFLTGDSFEKLTASESEYLSASASREILRSVKRVSVSDGTPFMMTIFSGYDNRELLPPFLPVKRGEDVVFGITLSKCFENGYFAHLPWVLVHSPVESRSFWRGEILRSSSGIDFYRLISACINPLEFAASETDGRERLRRLGTHLEQSAGAPAPAFAEFARTQVWRECSLFIAKLENLLESRGGAPEFWANDIRRYVANLREALTKEDCWVPLDLLYGRDPDDARALTQRLVMKFGQLLRWWPEMVEVARDLRAQGHRVAQQV